MAYTTINKSTDYFNTKLYTGNGSVRTETGVGFQPDLTWIKDRTGTNAHVWTDAVRGANYQIYSNLTNAQTNASGYLTAFASDGFTLGTDGAVNQNSSNYASWNWRASGTSGSSNTDGSITSTVSANTTAGFSIVSYTGTGSNATVGHGLSSAPAFIIFKDRSATKDWFVYHQSISPATGGKLNSTANPSADSSYFQNTATTSSVFSIGTANTVNPSGNNMIAYCFAEKTGYSKFGSYTGNGSSDGTFVYTGFKPAMVIVKQSNTSRNWLILDNKRNEFNDVDKFLKSNTSDAEGTTTLLDFTSNGFKCRTTDTGVNESGGTYIYMAFGQSLVGSNNVPCTAR